MATPRFSTLAWPGPWVKRRESRANTVLGTLDYASPEQLSDASRADVRSDLYSVGCTLYFTLSGRPPFEGGDVINKIFRQRLDDPEPLENIARGVPAAFAAMVRKLMAKKPDERYQTCKELRADMARWTDPARLRDPRRGSRGRAILPTSSALPGRRSLRLLSIADDTSPSVLSLRNPGDAEPSPAPRHRGRCLRFPPRSGTGPSPTPHLTHEQRPAGYSIFP